MVTAFNSGNVEAVIALYEDDSALVPHPGQVVTGKKDIREALKGFLAIEGDMQIETTWSVQSGDIALTRSLWSIRAGDEVKIQKAGNEIMRRQADGSWLFVVDHPYGSEAAQ